LAKHALLLAGLLPVLATSCSQLAVLLQHIQQLAPNSSSSSSSSTAAQAPTGTAAAAAAAAAAADVLKADGVCFVSEAVMFLLLIITNLMWGSSILQDQPAVTEQLWQPACSLVLAVVRDAPLRAQQPANNWSHSSSISSTDGNLLSNCRKYPVEAAVAVAKMLPVVIHDDVLAAARLPAPFGRQLTAAQGSLVCGQQLLQVAMLNVAASVQQVYKEKGGTAAVPLAAEQDSAAGSSGSSSGSSSSSSRQQQQQRWAVQPHHATLVSAAVPGLPAELQLNTMRDSAQGFPSSQTLEPHLMASMLRMLEVLLAVRADNSTPRSSSSSSSRGGAALPLSLAVPLYGCVAELPLLMAGQPEVVAACCSTAAAVCGYAGQATRAEPAAAAAAAAGGSAPDVLAELNQLLLSELLPAAVHAFENSSVTGDAAAQQQQEGEVVHAMLAGVLAAAGITLPPTPAAAAAADAGNPKQVLADKVGALLACHVKGRETGAAHTAMHMQ
jgi:hypothetical protein